jgi:hypothetical protein
VNKSRNPAVIASMKTNLIGLAVAATALTSFSAFANDWDDGRVHVSVGVGQPPCDDAHAAAPVVLPAPAARPGGRYELRDTQRWIPERYEQVTVQECRQPRHGNWNRHAKHCWPVTTTRLVPGYYQTVQEWVWVPHYPHHRQYSQYPSQPPPRAQARIGFRFGTH